MHVCFLPQIGANRGAAASSSFFFSDLQHSQLASPSLSWVFHVFFNEPRLFWKSLSYYRSRQSAFSGLLFCLLHNGKIKNIRYDTASRWCCGGALWLTRRGEDHQSVFLLARWRRFHVIIAPLFTSQRAERANRSCMLIVRGGERCTYCGGANLPAVTYLTFNAHHPNMRIIRQQNIVQRWRNKHNQAHCKF